MFVAPSYSLLVSNISTALKNGQILNGKIIHTDNAVPKETMVTEKLPIMLKVFSANQANLEIEDIEIHSTDWNSFSHLMYPYSNQSVNDLFIFAFHPGMEENGNLPPFRLKQPFMELTGYKEEHSLKFGESFSDTYELHVSSHVKENCKANTADWNIEIVEPRDFIRIISTNFTVNFF